MKTIQINPEGEYEIGIGEDDDGQTYCMVTLPDPHEGVTVELVFMLPAFVTFSDWLAMTASELLAGRKYKPLPDR